MKFKVSLQNGESIEILTEDIKSVDQFAKILGAMEPGKFVIIGKAAISKNHVVSIQEID